MSKKKKKQELIPAIHEDTLGMNYLGSLEEDDKYTTDVDPTGFYQMSNDHKKFVELYVEHNNLVQVATIMEIEPSQAKSYFIRYSTQKEIKRINAALYHRRVATNIIGFEEIGSFLSSWLIGQDVTEADALKKGEKLQVVRLLMDWHKTMREIVEKPEMITTQTIEEEIKELSVANIQQLINTKSKLMQKSTELKDAKEAGSDVDEELTKEELIEQVVNDDELTTDELAYLNTLSVAELLKILKEDT